MAAEDASDRWDAPPKCDRAVSEAQARHAVIDPQDRPGRGGGRGRGELGDGVGGFLGGDQAAPSADGLERGDGVFPVVGGAQ